MTTANAIDESAVVFPAPVLVRATSPAKDYRGTKSLPLNMLQLGEWIRTGAVSERHIALLAEIGQWDPILVTRKEKLIVDGRYRYLAAKALGRDHIECRFFDGDAESAFVESVRLNVQHGRPLTLHERKNAAKQIVRSQNGWSDRRIAETCSISPNTVAGIRRSLGSDGCPTMQNGQLDTREGRDHRVRVVKREELRRRIEAALIANPDSSLRQIAQKIGGSPETVRKVRHDLQTPSRSIHELAEPSNFSQDQALASTAAVTAFSTWFDQTSINPACLRFAEIIPLSRVYEIADEARRRASYWNEFAESVERKVRSKTDR